MDMEDDDDTHICLKCHTTISGLHNYVSHRKSGCSNQSSEHSKPRTLSPLMPPDEPDFALKADDFFSLLELQSSSKKSTIPVPSSGKSNSGVLTRSKATAVIQASNPSRASDWIGGHQLRELGNEDNQTKLINAVNSISGHQIKKDEPTRLNYEDVLEEDSNDEYDDDEEDFEDVDCHNGPPRSHTGGKWKPSASPIQWLRPSSSHHHEDRNEWDTPPPSHTGGKWKPMPPPQSRRASEGEDEEDKNTPPPDHTKGKWIPGKLETTNPILEQIPPLRKSCGTVQYWCGPCNRRLASKVVYDRHLRSELHYKRTIHEREFENSSEYLNQKNVTSKQAASKRKIKKPEQLWMNLDIKKKSAEELKKKRIKKRTFVKCEVCRSKVLDYLMGKHLISHYHCRKRNNLKPVSQQMVLDNILGIILQSPFQCSCCRFFCNNESDFLRHWRSIDHISNSDSISGIFLCLFCKYETQHNDVMENHLLSESHKEVVSVINRSVPIIIKRIIPVKCDTCGKIFRYNAELRKHCVKENHVLSNSSTDKYQQKHYCSECNLVLKSHKSLQRHLLRKHRKNYFFCSVCALTFQTELEIKLHRKSSQHKYAVIDRNYEKGYQKKDITRTCQYCYLRFQNVMYLKKHLQKQHPEHSYNCPHCGLKFTLSQEVTQHIKSKSCNYSSSSTPCFFNCEKCLYKTNSEGDYLFHLALHSDPIPIYPSNAAASTSTSGSKPVVMQYKCPVCEKIFRKGSLKCHVRQHANEKPFKCGKCKAAYARKSNLVDHMKLRHKEEIEKKSKKHTRYLQEEFDKRGQLDDSELGTNDGKMERNTEKEKDREKKYLCADCGKRFLKKFTLLQHNCTHTGKDYACDHTGCVYRARTPAELRLHAATHYDATPFACSHCQYRTKTRSQLNRHLKIHEGIEARKHKCPFCNFSARLQPHLKRHLRLHTGAKPFRCPHCTYTCNNLENLRKHILSTNKHPGKFIYTCSLCSSSTSDSFATNFAKEFRVHLVTKHADSYDSSSAKEATSRLVGIYHAEEDAKVVQNVKRENESGVLLTSVATSHSRSSSTIDNELLSMVVAREDVVYVTDADTNACWTMQGYYDVEESGTLIPFHEGEEGLLSERFNDEDEH